MYKKTIRSSLLFLLCLVSSINSMDHEKLFTLAAGSLSFAAFYYLMASQAINKHGGLWITTSDNDNHVMYLTPDIVSQCERLKQHSHLYPTNTENNPLSKICFTKKEMDTFINALNNCSIIDYENNLNTIMKVAEKCGAYLLYAHCVSHCLGDVKDIDTQIIVPLLKTLTHNNESDFILSTLVALKNISLSSFVSKDTPDVCDVPFTENKDYYLVNADSFTQPGPSRVFRKDYEEEHIIFDRNKKEIYRFKAFNLKQRMVSWDLKEPYLLKTKKNLVLFYIHQHGNPYPDTAILYDFINEKKIAQFSGHTLHISADEKYIGIINNDLSVYSIENCDDIKCKKINYPGKSFRDFEFSFDSQHLIGLVGDNANNCNISHWNFSDFDWNNENYLPANTVLSDNINAVTTDCYLRFCKDNNLIIQLSPCTSNSSAQKILMVIDFNNQEPDGNYSTEIMQGNLALFHKIDLAIRHNNETCSHKESCFEVFSIKDLSCPLYHYRCNFPVHKDTGYCVNSSFLGITFAVKNHKPLLLHYDVANNSILDTTHNIEGHIYSINNNGWVVTSPSTVCPQKEISLFDNRGKKIVQLPCEDGVFGVELSPEGHDLRIFKFSHYGSLKNIATKLYGPLGSVDFCSPKKERLLLKTTLYTQEESEQCDESYNGITTQQYAFFDTLYSDCHQRTTNNMVYLKKDTPLEKAFDSFMPNEKSFIKDKLKVIEQSK